jgi:hypothetical protein
MYDQTWAAVIAVVGVLVTCVVTYKISKKSEWCGLVSKNRMDWIISFRSNISKMLANGKCIFRFGENDSVKSKEKIKGKNNLISLHICYEQAKDEILSRLNLKEYLHTELKGEIERLDLLIEKGDDISDLESVESEILDTTRKILKPEFERVKREAKGDE